LHHGAVVHPLYVQSSLYWEAEELDHLRRFLQALRSPLLQPLHVLEVPVTDLYGEHWSLIGTNVPDAASPDHAVFLPGRNVLLLTKAMLWCHLNRVPELTLALLEANPFPDATPAFFASMHDAVNQAIGGAVRLSRPYAGLSKAQVLVRGQDLPLELTFSCLRPVAGAHPGPCNKCAEPQRRFPA